MEKLLVLLILLAFSQLSYAELPTQKGHKFQEGVFKKKRNGDIVQYDKNNKKIRTYKIRNGKIVSVK